MTATAHDTHTDADHAEAGDHGHAANHDMQYVKVFLLLVVITAVEVWLSYAGLPNAVFLPALLALMAVKFVYVIRVFMHLKFETASIFGRLFYIGLGFALAVYIAALTTFEFWAS